MATRRLIFLPLVALSCFAGTVRAGETVFESGPAKVHLLELFTSEGCSSCPPAETWLSGLKQHDRLWRDFVPVAFHVDYWDRLGWRDRFASKEWTQRQQQYAARWKASTVYTPGFVLDGAEASAQVPTGSSEKVGTLRLKIDGNDVAVSFKPAKTEARGYEVYLAGPGSSLASNVAAGENRGRKLSHDFVVLWLQKAPLPADLAEVKFKIDRSNPGKTGALAAWVVYAGDVVPIQATGGWLTN
jgi:hypothetical protein